MISNKDFEKVIDCLPEGLTWGQALTPHIALHIVNAALASQEPTLKNNEFIPDSTEGRIQAAIKCLNMHWVSHDANRFDYAIEGLEKCLAGLASQAQQENHDELTLRRLLCMTHSGAAAYTDDGELQDNTTQPFIDFKRDSAWELQKKIHARFMNSVISQSPSPEGEKP